MITNISLKNKTAEQIVSEIEFHIDSQYGKTHIDYHDFSMGTRDCIVNIMKIIIYDPNIES